MNITIVKKNQNYPLINWVAKGLAHIKVKPICANLCVANGWMYATDELGALRVTTQLDDGLYKPFFDAIGITLVRTSTTGNFISDHGLYPISVIQKLFVFDMSLYSDEFVVKNSKSCPNNFDIGYIVLKSGHLLNVKKIQTLLDSPYSFQCHVPLAANVYNKKILLRNTFQEAIFLPVIDNTRGV